MEVFLGQTMIGAQYKYLGVADHNVQSMENAEIGIVAIVFMGVALQDRNVAAIAITVDLTAIGEGGMGEFPHR